MDTLEVQHWTIIGLLVLQVAVIASAAAWSISKVNTHLERQYSVLRDISGFMLLLTSMERVRGESHSQTTVTETSTARTTVSGEGLPTEVSR